MSTSIVCITMVTMCSYDMDCVMKLFSFSPQCVRHLVKCGLSSYGHSSTYPASSLSCSFAKDYPDFRLDPSR